MRIPGFIFLLILLLILASGNLNAASTLDCVRYLNPSPSLQTVPVAVERVSAKPLNLSVFLPFPNNSFVLSMNDNKLAGVDGNGGIYLYPVHFLLGDGTLESPFIEVDLRVNSNLQTCLYELRRNLLAELRSQSLAYNKENLTILLKTFISNYLQQSQTQNFSDRVQIPPVLTGIPGQNLQLLPNLFHQVVPLELYLKQGQGVCLQKALLTSLLMKMPGIEIDHQIRMGGTEKIGHTWIELSDGRHLDPTWNLLIKPTQSGSYWEDWFEINETRLFRYRTYPYSVLQLN